jgi:acyl-CoA dehydrogenase
MTAGAIDLGEKPSVISAIVKYHLTERGRQVINDAMDVHGGKGICMGPNNYLGRAYQQIPVAITVEGANILTRSMIIFGQGAIRGHPYVLKEMQATHEADDEKALREFDAAFFGHMAFAISNLVRAAWVGLTGSLLVFTPGDKHTRRYYRQLTRLSSAFAWASDVSMFVLGSALKRRERLSARLGDILSQLYLASTVLKRFHDDGAPEEDASLMHWAMQDALNRAQEAFYGLFENMPNRLVACLLRVSIFPWGRVFHAPADTLGSKVVGLLMTPGAARDRLTQGMCIPIDPDDPVTALDAALLAVIAAEPVEAKMRAAKHAGTIGGEFSDQLAQDAVAKGVINAQEAELLARAKALRRKAIMVDDFPKDFGRSELFQTTQAVSFEALGRVRA